MGNQLGSSLTHHAHAKINLGLEIMGKRPDGFHEIATVMQTIDLHDVLTVMPSNDLTLRSNSSAMETLDNIVLRAARELRAAAGTDQGASIYIDKRIPPASGLGGGSSDAACAIQALSSLWKLDLSRDELIAIGARLGSDVPFFFYGGTALVRGRGEIVTPLPPLGSYYVLLVCPRVQIPEKTRLLYSKITPAKYSDGKMIDHLAEALRREQQLDLSALTNVFQPILLAKNAAVRACYDRLSSTTSNPVLLSGAGPSLFVLTQEDEARRMLKAMGDLSADVFLTRACGRQSLPQ